MWVARILAHHADGVDSFGEHGVPGGGNVHELDAKVTPERSLSLEISSNRNAAHNGSCQRFICYEATSAK